MAVAWLHPCFALLAAAHGAGASVVVALDVYGATFTLLRGLFSTLGVNVRLWMPQTCGSRINDRGVQLVLILLRPFQSTSQGGRYPALRDLLIVTTHPAGRYTFASPFFLTISTWR